MTHTRRFQSLMLACFGLLALSTATGLAAGFECTQRQQAVWKELSPGVEWTRYDVSFTPYFKDSHQWQDTQSRSVTVRALRLDFGRNELSFHRPATRLACDPVRDRYIRPMIQDLERDQRGPVIAAINSNFFIMPEGGILGIAIDEHKAWSLDLASLLKPSSGVLGIESGQPFLESKDVLIGRWGPTLDPKDAARFSFAVQGYPRLIQDGNLAVTDEVLNARHPRTSIGIDSNSGRVLLVTIDASAEGESGTIGMTLFEYAHLLKSTSCGVTQSMALNLDGGGSSAFAIPSLGLYEQADHCRHLGNILTIRAR